MIGFIDWRIEKDAKSAWLQLICFWEGDLMCNPRRLTRREMLGFIKWKDGLHKEDIREFGCIVERPPSEYQALYRIYLDTNKPRN